MISRFAQAMKGKAHFSPLSTFALPLPVQLAQRKRKEFGQMVACAP